MISAGPAPESTQPPGRRAARRTRPRPWHCARPSRDLRRAAQSLAEGDPLRVREAGDVGLGAVADAPLGHVEDPSQAHVVGRVGHHPQVGQDVADLPALVEARAADDLVGQPGADEHLLQRPGLGVGPVEHRDVARPGQALVGEAVDLVAHEGGLVVLGVGDVADDLLPGAGVGPQLLGLPVGVARDDGVRRREDRLRRAVVLVEHDLARVGEVRAELHDVAHRGAPEGVDRLVGVADHDQFTGGDLAAGPADQLRDEAVLGVVGVLVLVDHDVAEPCVGSARRRRGTRPCSATVCPMMSSKSTAWARARRVW